MRNRPLLQLTVIGVVASLVGVAIALLIDWFPTSASEEARPIDTLYDVLLAVSVPIFVLVMAVAIYSVIRFRAKPGDDRDGPPIHGNAKLEVVWVTIPFLLVTALAIYGWVVLVDIEEAESDALQVEVTGEQFTWSFAYPGEEGEDPVRSTELMLPVDRQVEFTIETQDVIHSFWIPDFRLKQDTVPGIETTIRLTPSELGTYNVVCAELCGLGHSTMRAAVTVMPDDEFNAWLGDQQQALAEQEGGAGGEGQSPSGLAGRSGPEEDDDGAGSGSGQSGDSGSSGGDSGPSGRDSGSSPADSGGGGA